MNAIHSVWTKPRIYQNGGFFVEDFDILTTVLSALKWREKNGRIKLVTDTAGLEFFKSCGMCEIWDEIDTSLDNIPDSINPEVFWAAGKLFSLGGETAPVASLDTDFIVWDRIAFNALGDITVIHREDITPAIYPDIKSFKMKEGYIFPSDFDMSERPANAAFYVIKNNEFKTEYVKSAVEFMENTAGDDRLTYMVFAEQRLMAMTAKRMGIAMGEFSTLQRLFADGERYFTHTWGMKQQMRENPHLRQDFCRRCIHRIMTDFSDYINMLKNINELQIYF